MNKDLLRLCSPKIVTTSLNSLCGLLEGIKCDLKVNELEVSAIKDWIYVNGYLSKKKPFDQIFKKFHQAFEDELLSFEEVENILWFCERFKNDGQAYNQITQDIQFLHGLVGGIASDEHINLQEVESLKNWLISHEYLQGQWPYDEFYSLCLSSLQDGIITAKEKEIISYYFREFLNLNGHNTLVIPLNEACMPIIGVCAVCPEIEFEYKTFVITGESSKFKRKELISLIEDCGGRVKSSVSSRTDYLIVMAEGSQAWSFAAYGRKVENAINLRKTGSHICIVHESDFWDAVRDFKAA